MEVHHHAHTVPIAIGRKKWTHYFWEFFMLFLAVTLGFFVENQREHLVDHKREKKFMEMLYDDLKSDTADYINDTTWWSGTIKRIDTIRMEIEKGTNERNSSLLYRKAANMRSNNSFAYHDRTIQQLKNGGNFRLIRSKIVADSLIEYDALILTGLKDLEAQSNVIYDKVNFMQDKILSTKYFHLRSDRQMNQLDSIVRIEPGVFDLSLVPKSDLMEYYNNLEFHQRLCRHKITIMTLLCLKAIRLIESLQKEYHLQ